MNPSTAYTWIKLIVTLVLLAVVGWLAYQILKKGKDTVTAVKESGQYLFGSTAATSTIGTDFYDFVDNLFKPKARADGKPAYWDDAQAAKTQAVLDARKSGMSSTISTSEGYTFITPEYLENIGAPGGGIGGGREQQPWYLGGGY